MGATGQHDGASGRRLRRPALAAAALLTGGAGVALLAGGLLTASTRSPWLRSALGSRGFLRAGAVVIVCGVGVLALGVLLWRAGSAGRRRRRAEDGAAVLEFAIALPFLLALVLVMVQSALLMVGNLFVHYAAYRAARSAVVTVPMDYRPSEPANILAPLDVSEKGQRIRRAAAWALLPVSTTSPQYTALRGADDLADGLATFYARSGARTPSWAQDAQGLARRWSYANEYTDVALAPPQTPPAYGPDEDLQVRVRHMLYLSVPYANWFCSQVLMRTDGARLGFGPAEYGLAIEATCRLPNGGEQDYVEEEQFP